MTFDRTGTALMLITAAWMAMLAFTAPPLELAASFRGDMMTLAIGLLVAALFPRHLELTGTVLVFSAMGVLINLATFQFSEIGWQGVVPTIVFGIALWCRRNRLDLRDVVGVAALVAFGIAIFQPNVVMFAWIVIALVNAVIWLVNGVSSFRRNRRSHPSARP